MVGGVEKVVRKGEWVMRGVVYLFVRSFVRK